MTVLTGLILLFQPMSLCTLEFIDELDELDEIKLLLALIHMTKF